MRKKKNGALVITVLGILLLMVILVFGTQWIGQIARRDTESAARSVSLLYLDELAGRREQVVEGNLQNRIDDIRVSISLMEPDDLSSMERLQAYQARIKQMYTLEKFAFVDAEGLIYTSLGTQNNIADYAFDPLTLSSPEISILNLDSPEKKVVIAVPVDHLRLEGKELRVCFMEIDMGEMLQGVSMETQHSEATFCNIYTSSGIALSNTVLGGLAVEDNLLEALSHADYEPGYSHDRVLADFSSGSRGIVSFTYGGIPETLAYVPVKGTDWFLTYLIRESLISDQISYVSSGIMQRSILQSALTVLVLLSLFFLILSQFRRNARLTLEKQTADAASQARQEELEQRLALQERLLEEERHRTIQDQMITAMATDYRSVYYVDLDHDDAVCYRADPADPDHHAFGDHFPYLSVFSDYARTAVAEDYREDFLRFISPESIRDHLEKEPILAFRYLARRSGREYYEMLRAAAVRQPGDRTDGRIHAVGMGFTIIDEEMRRSMAQRQALRDALTSAEQASRAKTAFLSSMSHEIRTPMNAVISLNRLALQDPETPARTREYLTKIASSADHLLALINDILDMSRIESGHTVLKPAPFPLSRLLDAVNTMFRSQCAEKGLTYCFSLESDDVPDVVGSPSLPSGNPNAPASSLDSLADACYIGDEMKLRQVLINILGNAVKFTPTGGSVSLTLRRAARFGGHATLVFRIEDTGIGIDPDYLPRIFDPFSQEDASSTNRYGSSGLGMAITKSLVDMMNGTIRVESEKGRGSVFTVTVALPEASSGETSDPLLDASLSPRQSSPEGALPSDVPSPAQPSPRDAASPGQFSPEGALPSDVPSPAQLSPKGSAPVLAGRRILLAEDIDINAEIVRMILSERDMTADRAENGRIAVELFSSHPADYYSAILMDMRMPEMGGLEATRTIRSLPRPDARTIPIIALTANASDEDVQRSLQAGLNAHLTKPIQPDLLFETLESLIIS